MKPVYENVTVSFTGNEYKLLKQLFSYLPVLFSANRSKFLEFIEKVEDDGPLDVDLMSVLGTICDLYSLDSDSNHELISVIRQFRDM